MKPRLALLLMTTTLCTSFGTGSSVFAAGQGLLLTPDANLLHRIVPGATVTPIDSDADEEGGGGDDCPSGAAGNAAKAGTVAPPKNGLFTNGTAPVVKSN